MFHFLITEIGNTHTLQEENFHWNLNFAISLMANSRNLNSAHDNTLRNLSMIAYIIKIQISKFANIFNFMNLNNLNEVVKSNSVYIFIL